MLRSRNQTRRKLLLSRKLRYFRGAVSHTVLYHQQLPITRDQVIKFVKNYFFLENYVTSVGAVSHTVLYHQQLPITRYQVRFCVYNYFE